MTEPPSSNPPEGWYPDPAGSQQLRWWDGTTWTENVQEPPPAPASSSAAVAPERPVGPAAAPPPNDPSDQGGGKKPWYRRTWVMVTAGIFVLLLIIGALAPSEDKKDEGAQADDASVAAAPAAADTTKTTATATPVDVTVSAPGEGQTVRAARVTVRGTVTPETAKVKVLGFRARTSGGVFSRSVRLEMGENRIGVVATAEGQPPATAAVTVTRGRTQAAIAAAAGRKKDRAAKRAARERAAAKRAAAEQAPSGGCITVPNMVGKDHQLAQDTMQAAGLYSLDEEDATGQGRLLLWDRNWTVVAQRPEGGACVSDDTTITLISKKDDE